MFGMTEYWSFVVECHHILHITAHLRNFVIMITEAKTKAYLHLCNYLSFIKKLTIHVLLCSSSNHVCFQMFIAYQQNNVVLQNIQVLNSFSSYYARRFLHKEYIKSKETG